MLYNSLWIFDLRKKAVNMFENALLSAALRQMLILGLFVGVGFVAAKGKVLPENANNTLSRLETYVFIPALVMGKFISEFTVETLSSAWKLLLFSLGVELLIIPIAILLGRLIAGKDDFLKKICTYGLAFSNFGFMGLPMIEAIFPQYSMHYVIFTLPLWALNFGWGVPFLLMDAKDVKKGLVGTLRRLANPIMIGLVIGAVIGISGFKLPAPVTETVVTLGSCMSPIAMMITGITFARMNVGKVLSRPSVYVMTALRLLMFPFVCGGAYLLITRLLGIAPAEFYYACLVGCAAMPLGLNSVVIPAGYGKDTSIAAGMVLISHLLSVATIPLVLTVFL